MRVARGELPATLRLYRPRPTLAFGRLDRLSDGFARAAEAARRQGFEPVLRAPGGHAAAYDDGTLAFDYVVPVERHLVAAPGVFRTTSAALAAALADLGVDARVGAVPGEYCPGEYSVNARGQVKLAGTAQRAVRGATLLGGFVTVRGSARLRAVLEPVYRELGLGWDPRSVGAVEEEVGGGVELAAVQRAVLAALAPGATDPPSGLDDETYSLAAQLEDQHAIARVDRG